VLWRDSCYHAMGNCRSMEDKRKLMTTRTTTIRIHDAQLRLLEVIANHDGVSVADVQRAAFSAYIDARAQADDALLTARGEIAADWRDKDEARKKEALQEALGESVT